MDTLQRFLASMGGLDSNTTSSTVVLGIVLVLTVAAYNRMGSLRKTEGSESSDNNQQSQDGTTEATASNCSNQETNSSSKSHASSSAVRKAASGTIWSIVVKLLSFLCTQQAFRLLDDNVSALGKAAIQLELLLSTILFVSREGFRLSLTKGSSSDNWNVAWLSIPVSTLAAAIALIWHLQSSTAQADYDYRLGGILYCVAAFVEGLAEPAALQALRQMEVATRVSAEGMASMCKTFATVLALQRWLPDWPIYSFGVAQLVYAIVYAAFLYTKTWSQLTMVDLRKGFDGNTCYLTVLFTIQGLFKHFLTEADRIVLSTLAGSYDQGIYAMAHAYGGLAARFLLQPLEETARLLWSRVSGSAKEDQNSLRFLEQSYIVLNKLVLYTGLTFCCFATNYTSILLNILAGRKWGSNEEAITTLSAFCIYTAFLAWNGMTEAFVFGVASSGGDIGRLGAMHSIVGVVFAVLAPLCVSRLGTVGVVAANCFCMALRSLYSMYFAAQYFARHDKSDPSVTTTNMIQRLIAKVSPHPMVLVCFGTSALVTRKSLQWLESHDDVATGSKKWFLLALKHVIVGGLCFLATCLIAVAIETEFRQSIRQLLRRKQD